MSDLREENGR